MLVRRIKTGPLSGPRTDRLPIAGTDTCYGVVCQLGLFFIQFFKSLEVALRFGSPPLAEHRSLDLA